MAEKIPIGESRSMEVATIVTSESRPHGLSQHEADVYDFVNYVKGSLTGNPMVRSNSFTLDDIGRQKKCIQFSMDMESNKEDYIRNLTQSKRRRSISLPELRDLRVISSHDNGGYAPILEAIEDDDESESYIVHDYPLRKTWSNKTDFIFTAFGLSLGLNSAWRFPYVCYKYSGGSFLFVYLFLMLVIGCPLLCMEYSVGQLTSRGQPGFSLFCPILKGTVLSAAFATSLLLPVYSTVNSWAMFYFIKSLFVIPPWSRCGYPWNSVYCINPKAYNKTHGSTLMENNLNTSVVNVVLSKRVSLGTSAIANVSCLGTASFYPSQEFFDNKVVSVNLNLPSVGMIKWELAILAACLWIAVFVTLRRNILFSSHATYSLAILPMTAFTFLFIRAVTLDGAKDGLLYFIVPDFSEVFQPELWLYASALCLHSIGAVLGISAAAAKCNREKNNPARDAVYVTIINVLVVLYIGVIVFSTLGCLAKQRGSSVAHVVDKEPGLAFVVYSELLLRMPLPILYSGFFYLLLFCSGIDYQIFVVASLFTTFEDLYWEKIKKSFYSRQFFVLACCCCFFFTTLVFLTQNGILLVSFFETYIAAWLVVILAVFEFVSIGWIYGSHRLYELVNSRLSTPMTRYFPLSWSFGALLLLAVLAANAYTVTELTISSTRNVFAWRVIGPVLLLTAMFLIVLFAYKEVIKTPKTSLISRFYEACKPIEIWTSSPIALPNELPFDKVEAYVIPQNGDVEYCKMEDVNFPLTLSTVQGLNRETVL